MNRFRLFTTFALFPALIAGCNEIDTNIDTVSVRLLHLSPNAPSLGLVRLPDSTGESTLILFSPIGYQRMNAGSGEVDLAPDRGYSSWGVTEYTNYTLGRQESTEQGAVWTVIIPIQDFSLTADREYTLGILGLANAAAGQVGLSMRILQDPLDGDVDRIVNALADDASVRVQATWLSSDVMVPSEEASSVSIPRDDAGCIAADVLSIQVGATDLAFPSEEICPGNAAVTFWVYGLASYQEGGPLPANFTSRTQYNLASPRLTWFRNDGA